MKKVIIIFILWYIVINAFALYSANRYNLMPDTAYQSLDNSKFKLEHKWDLTYFRIHWDANWYLNIAQYGYSYNQTQNFSNLVFFPLYPILINFFSFLFGSSIALSGWILSSFFLLLALIFLYKLICQFHPDTNPYSAIILLLIFPTAFFFIGIYAESLFLFLSLTAFYYAFKKNYLAAGIFGLLASLTRITGALLFIPILWEYFNNNNFKLKQLLNLKIIPILIIPMGTAIFFFLHYIKFGDFLLFFKIEKNWGRDFNLNISHLHFITHPSILNFIIDISFIFFILIAIYYTYKRIRISYALYMLTTLAVIISSGTLMSIGRYLLVLFPIYIFGSTIKNQYLQYIWIFSSILLLSIYTNLYVNDYWAG